MTATTHWASGEAAISGVQRAIRYTPAVTIVAAWIKALTGEGPSMASGSHTCSGNWALLPHAPNEQQQANRRGQPPADERPRRGQPRLAEHAHDEFPIDPGVVEVQRAVGRPDQEQSQEEAAIAEAGHEKGLFARRGRRRFFEPEADQQVAAQAHHLPKHVEHGEIARRHQHRHREDEQADVREEPPVARIAVHVTDRVDRHQRGDASNDGQHGGRQRIGPQGDVDASWFRLAQRQRVITCS